MKKHELFTIPLKLSVHYTDGSHFYAIWQKRPNITGSIEKPAVLSLVCIDPEYFSSCCSSTVISVMPPWHNKLLVYASCISDEIAFYRYPLSIKYWWALNSSQDGTSALFLFFHQTNQFQVDQPQPYLITILPLFQSLIYIIRALSVSFTK